MASAARVRDHYGLSGVRRSRSAVASAMALALAGCATASREAPPPSPSVPAASRREPPALPSTGEQFAELVGWAEEDHVAALAAFVRGCGVSRDLAMRAVCARGRGVGPLPEGAARQFFEFNFRLAPVPVEGVLTAYFAPEYEARAAADAEFSAPVRPRPPGGARPYASVESAGPVIDPLDLLRDPPDPPASPSVLGPVSEPDRATLARAPSPDALAWMRPEDLFFMQIQGSGALTFPDGRRVKATYAGDNGWPFVAIARPMMRQGLLAPDRVSGETIRAWLAAHAGAKAQAVMNLDPRYVFFALEPDDGSDPRGAAGVTLTAGRALAVDPGYHEYGELWWIEAEAPVLRGAVRRYRRLALALDTGSAIRGEGRADLYLGRGRAAGEEAGRVRHTLRLVRFVPRDDAR